MDDLNNILGMSDSVLAEQARLIELGIRPLMLLPRFPSDDDLMLRVATRLETVCGNSAVPFVIAVGNGTAECGFAASKWVVETLDWITKKTEDPYRSRLLGLLLGYSTSAIQDFEQKQSIRWFKALDE